MCVYIYSDEGEEKEEVAYLHSHNTDSFCSHSFSVSKKQSLLFKVFFFFLMNTFWSFNIEEVDLLYIDIDFG